MRKGLWQQIIFVVILVGIPLSIYYYLEGINFGTRLKVFGPKEKNEKGEMVDHTIAPFSYIDQLGDTITQEDFNGKVYIANYFFASCPTVCPRMLTQVMRVQKEFKGNPHFRIISHTVDPRHDSSAVLYLYSHNYNADSSMWYFVTGDRKQIYLNARNSYLIDNIEGDGGRTDFIHSQYIVLIDTARHIRGYYNGVEPKEVNKLIKDIHYLLKEYYGSS